MKRYGDKKKRRKRDGVKKTREGERQNLMKTLNDDDGCRVHDRNRQKIQRCVIWPLTPFSGMYNPLGYLC